MISNHIECNNNQWMMSLWLWCPSIHTAYAQKRADMSKKKKNNTVVDKNEPEGRWVAEWHATVVAIVSQLKQLK